jgi:hypothetical protein
MTEDEKAARLLFYRQQAQTQWDKRELALRSVSRPFFIVNRIGLYISAAVAAVIALATALLGVADLHYLGALAFVIAVPISIALLRLIRKGDAYPAKQSDWKRQLLAVLAYLLWWALWVGVCVIAIADQMRSS